MYVMSMCTISMNADTHTYYMYDINAMKTNMLFENILRLRVHYLLNLLITSFILSILIRRTV